VAAAGAQPAHLETPVVIAEKVDQYVTVVHDDSSSDPVRRTPAQNPRPRAAAIETKAAPRGAFPARLRPPIGPVSSPASKCTAAVVGRAAQMGSRANSTERRATPRRALRRRGRAVRRARP
jgi:hypothetical protein